MATEQKAKPPTWRLCNRRLCFLVEWTVDGKCETPAQPWEFLERTDTCDRWRPWRLVCPARSGGVETLRRVAESAGQPSVLALNVLPPPSNLWAVAMAVLLRILMIEEKCGFSVAASGMHVQLLILKCVKQRPVKVRSTLQRQLRYLVFAGDKCEATAAWEHCRAGLSFHLCTQLWACWTK